MERLRMASASIRIEMRNMINKLQKQEGEMMKIGNEEYLQELNRIDQQNKGGEYPCIKIEDVVLKAPYRGHMEHQRIPGGAQGRDSPDKAKSACGASPREGLAGLRNCRPLECKKRRLSRQKKSADGKAETKHNPRRGEAPKKKPKEAPSPSRGEAPAKTPKVGNSTALLKGGAGAPRPPTDSRPGGQGTRRPSSCDKNCLSCGYT